MKFDVIIFDLDETIFDFKKAERIALENTFLNCGLSYEAKYLLTYKEINSALWRELEENKISMKHLKKNRFKYFLEKLKINYDYNRFNKTYIEELSKGSYLLPHAEDVIKELNKYYKLAVMTNGFEYIQKSRIEKSNVANYFKEVIISETVNSLKPDSGIFLATSDALKIFDKSRTLMVGDNLKTDILGANNFGFKSCWYNPSQIDLESEIKPDYIINCLTDLFKIC